MLIADQNELSKYQSVSPKLQPHQCYMVALYSRKKYGGQQYQYGRVLFQDNLEMALQRLWFEYSLRPHSPTSSLVVYISVNPINCVEAYANFAETMNKLAHSQLIGMSNNKQVSQDGFARMQSYLMSAHQSSIQSYPYVDIDIDGGPELLSIVTQGLSQYHVITTHGGYHVLIEKQYIPKNLHLAVQQAATHGEVVFNPNRLIPLPGTLQGGKLVTYNAVGIS